MINFIHVEQDAKYYDKIYKNGYRTARYKGVYNFILDEAVGFCPYDVCGIFEVGCGNGSFAIMASKKYPYWGFDFSAEGVRTAKLLELTADFEVGDAYDKEMYSRMQPNAVVVCIEVLEHLDDIAVIENIPEGVYLVASVPNYPDRSHLRCYLDTQEDIRERFKDYLDINLVKSLPMGANGERIHVFGGLRR